MTYYSDIITSWVSTLSPAGTATYIQLLIHTAKGANMGSELPVDIGFVPTQALAAKLDVRDEGTASALARFDTTRDAARNVSGRFRTNTIPIESVSTVLGLRFRLKFALVEECYWESRCCWG
jgi:hypothetical protein